MTLIDQLDRDRALDPSRSFIVQAPAGSGKTGLLVRRLLSLLCVVEKPEEILAITFTRKATAEMRDRVISALDTARRGGTFKPHEQDMARYAQQAVTRDHEKQWMLLEQPHRLRIQTIDSLCTELVRKMPWSTRFGTIPRIETDVQKLYLQASTQLLQQMGSSNLRQALTTLLKHSSGNLQSLRTRLANMLYQREKWLELIYRQRALASRSRVDEQWLGVIEPLLEALEKECGEHLVSELLSLLRYSVAHRNDALAVPADNLQQVLETDAPRPTLEIRILCWRMIADLLLKADGDFKKTVNKNHGFPVKDSHKTRMLEILGEMQDDERLRDAFQDFLAAPDPLLRDEEWQQLAALEQVLPALAQQLYVLMMEHNCSDYDELSRRALDALGPVEQPTDLALLQDYRIQHILMDEFQDTSLTQKELLERLTAGWQHEESGRSLFLVGDPMQSIYGFRNADVRVFLEARDQGINDIKPESLELKINFRSSPDIIDWVNRVMHGVFPQEDVPEQARVRYTPSVSQLEHSGSVLTHLCVADTDQLAEDYRYSEAWQIQKHIKRISEQHPGDSIAVLARKRKPLADLAEVLRKSAIEFEALDLENPAEQSVINDLVSLAGVFINPMDTLAWLAILRAPWCGLMLKDLTRLRDSGYPLFRLVQESCPGLEDLSSDGERRLSNLRNSLSPVYALGRGNRISELLRRAWLALRGPACYDAHELVHVEPFFDMLHELESEADPLNRERLLEACGLYGASSPANRIQLMTFHKAKGLEFDHVILTGLSSVSAGDQRQQPLLQSTQYGDHLLVASSPRASDTAPTRAAFVRRHLQSIENEEAARILYVAVTRPRTHLALFATLKRAKDGTLQTPRKGSLLRLLWPELEVDFSRAENQSTVSDQDKPSAQDDFGQAGLPLQRVPSTLTSLDLPEAIHFDNCISATSSPEIEFSWAREEARIIGLVVHDLLEHANLPTLKQQFSSMDSVIIAARLGHHGMAPDRVTTASKRIADILRSIARDERAHWIFSPDHKQTHREWPLSCAQEGSISRYVIDRSFIDEHGTRWIIDFKTSHHEGSDLQSFLDEEERRYRQQLDQYAALVRMLEPHTEIRLGLYFPAHAEWRERKYAD